MLTKNEFLNPIKLTFNKVKKAAISILFLTMFVQVFVNSGTNFSLLASMPVVMAQFLSNHFGFMWPIMAVFIGGLGAFITGSSTVSNLLFSQFQYDTAMLLSINPVIILALQCVGSAVGNMIALTNVVTAMSIVGIQNKDHIIIRKNLVPFLIYVLLIGFLGMIFI